MADAAPFVDANLDDCLDAFAERNLGGDDRLRIYPWGDHPMEHINLVA